MPCNTDLTSTNLARRRLLIALAAAIAGTQTNCHNPRPFIIEEGFTVFNAPVTLKFADTQVQTAMAAVEAAQQIMQPFYQRIHPWKDSELTRFNAALQQDGEAVATDDLLELIKESQRLYHLTEGRFDPASGALVAMWGFHSSSPNRARQLPAAQEIEQWRSNRPRMEDLIIEGSRVRSTHPRLQLDFNAIAEGMAARRIRDMLRELGVRNCIFDPGGDLLIIGQAGRRPWNLAIQNPFGRSASPLASIELSGDWALYSSGSYQRRFEFEGRHYSHILDPRTGLPAADVLASTVLHADPVIADAAATALVVAGPSEAPSLASRLGLAGYLLVTADRTVHLSENWLNGLRFIDTRFPLKILSA